jgi:hypothetical protein
VNDLDTLATEVLPAPSLAQICRLQAALMDMPQAEAPVQHHFTDHAYARELFVPAGMMLVGKMHATRHLLVVTGDCTIINGEHRQRITGTRVLHTEPGTKRAIFTHADTTLITFHVTEETDLEKIEDAIILPDPVELLTGATA